MTEKAFFQQLKRNLEGPQVHLQRIETSTGRGIPDVNYCAYGAEGWLELKHWERKTTRGLFKIPKLRPEQVSWLLRRRCAGGRAFILGKMNKDVLAFDGAHSPYLFKGIDWRDLNQVCPIWLKPPIKWDKLIEFLCQEVKPINMKDIDL